MIILFYVDDLIKTGNNGRALTKLKAYMRRDFIQKI